MFSNYQCPYIQQINDKKNYKFDMNNQRKFLILAVLVGIAGVGIGAATIFSMVSELYSP